MPAEGVGADPEKYEAVREWPVPTNLKQMQSFLEFRNYYHVS